jgi:hypothetical protein
MEREVFVPIFLAWIEQFDHGACLGINPGEVRALVGIAPVAGQSKIGSGVASAMLFGRDMFDLKSGEGELFLAKAAILATLARALSHQILRCLVH